MTPLPDPLTQLSLDELRERTSMKWREFASEVLPVWVAEMDVPTPEPVARALTEAIRRGDTGYPIGSEYAGALGAFARERWGWDGVEPSRTSLVPDVMMGVVEVLKLITAPGDPVIVNSPVYPPFFMFVGNMDRRIVEAPLGVDGRLDFDVLEAAFRDVARTAERAAYLLCSPHNPTGTLHTADELARVAELAESYGVRVVVDEIHAPLVSPAAVFTPYLSVEGASSGFSLMSASKGWNLAGLKAALAIAGPDAADDLARMPEEVRHGPSHLGVIAHVAAYREGGAWLDSLLRGLDDRRRLLASLLAEQLPEVGWSPEPATYMAWLDCRELGLGDDPAAAFVERGRVALTPGIGFGAGGKGFARLNFATSPEILREAVRRMASAIG